jgi:hypothetical protein
LVASHEKSVEAADEVIRLLGFELETWQLLMSRMAEPAAATPAAGNSAGVTPATGGGGYSASVTAGQGAGSYSPFTAHA